MLQRLCCLALCADFGLSDTCMSMQISGRNLWHMTLATNSIKRCIDLDRLYRPGLAVYITLGRLREVPHELR